MTYQRKPVNIKGWEMYEVDTNGVVYSKSGKPLKYSLNHKGYCIVNFCHNNNRKGFGVHTLVATTFIENTENKPTVNHIDGNKQNNNVENLEWSTYKEQTTHAKKVLGFRNDGHFNGNAKHIKGYDIKTGELKYDFNSVSEAAKYFVQEEKNYRSVVKILSRVANSNQHKTYKYCIWKYN